MKHNIWNFLRKPDGTYAVSHDGKLLSHSIPEKWFESQICEHYGFCGKEYHDIRAQLERSGKCTVDLSAACAGRRIFQASHFYRFQTNANKIPTSQLHVTSLA